MPGKITMHEFLIFYAGISFLATFYWLISSIYSRRRNYLILASATAIGTMFYLNYFEIILHNKKAELALMAFMAVAFFGLAAELHGFRRNLSSRLFYAYIAFVLPIIIIPLFSPIFFTWQTALTISYLLLILGNMIVMVLFAYLWIRKGQSAARFSFLANLPNATGCIIFSLSRINVIPSGLNILGPIGGTVFLLLLFYRMVTYVFALRKKREKEQLEKEELIRQQNILLEQKIKEKTRELEIERERSEELLIAASQKQMAELELQSLRARLNPHFMFNSLTAIQQMILKEDIENSHTYLARFAKLLRMLLENSDKPFASLQKEIDFIELYLSLEKLRLPDLQVSITTDPCINREKTLIPNMILQPYIENALWHGLSHKKANRKLELSVHKQNGSVIYEVIDNGVGRTRSAELKNLYRKNHKSKGMELLAKRFKLLSEEFGSEIKTEVSDVMTNGEPGGTRVTIVVPDSLNQTTKTIYHDMHHYY